MNPGDKIKATWSDGLVLTGVFEEEKQGFILLRSENGERIVCSPSHVKFEVIEDS